MNNSISIGELREACGKFIRGLMNNCEQNPLYNGVNSRLAENNFSGRLFTDTATIAAGFSHYLISRENYHPNAAIETASRVIYEGTLAVIGRDAPEYIRSQTPSHMVGQLRNASDKYTKALQTVDAYQREAQQQQQQNTWGGNQNNGWGNNQGGWGNNQNSGWGNGGNNGWGGNQNNGWNGTQNSLTNKTSNGFNNGWNNNQNTNSVVSNDCDPFDLAASMLDEPQPNQAQRPNDNMSFNQGNKHADAFFDMLGDGSGTSPQPQGDVVVIGGVTYRKEAPAVQKNTQNIAWKDTREDLLAAGLRSTNGSSTYAGNSEPPSAWTPSVKEAPIGDWHPLVSKEATIASKQEETLLPSANVSKPQPLLDAPKAVIAQAIKDSPHRACPVYNVVKQKPYLTLVNPKTGEIVMRRISDLTLNYEAHESELVVPMSSRLDQSEGSIQTGSKTLARALLKSSVDDYRKAVAEHSAEKGIEAIIAESPTIVIDPYVIANDNSQYWSAATVALTALGVEVNEFNLNENIINFNAIKNSQFLINKEAKEYIGSALRARIASKVVEHVMDFHDCDHQLPNAEVNRLHENATKLLNVYLETHFEAGLTVTSWINDYDELSDILTQDYPGDLTARKLNAIYALVARDTFGGFDETTLRNRGLNPDDFGVDADSIVIAQVTNITLLPCRYADIPFGFVGDYGVVTDQQPELYDLLVSFSERNPNVNVYKMITTDNVELKFHKAVAVGVGIAFYISR